MVCWWPWKHPYINHSALLLAITFAAVFDSAQHCDVGLIHEETPALLNLKFEIRFGEREAAERNEDGQGKNRRFRVSVR